MSPRRRKPPSACAGLAEVHAIACEISFEAESFKITPDQDATFPTDTLDRRLVVYNGVVTGWLLDWAAELNNHPHAGFAVLQLGFSYFEAHAPYCAGEKWTVSERAFKHGVRCVFPGLPDAVVDVLWKDGRNGFFHDGLVRERLVIADVEPTFRYELRKGSKEARVVLVDRRRFIDAMMNHHERYLATLRDPSETRRRERFMRGWEIMRGASRRKRR